MKKWLMDRRGATTIAPKVNKRRNIGQERGMFKEQTSSGPTREGSGRVPEEKWQQGPNIG